MDGQRFDDLTRALARGVTRRNLVARLAGGALGGLLATAGISGIAAQRTLCSGDGAFCLRDGNCCSGRCDGRTCAPSPRCLRGQVACGGNCVDATSFETDPHNCGACGNVCGGGRAPTGACEEWTCNAGRCETRLVADGTGCDDGDPCTYRDQCQRGVCRGFRYRCDDGNPCTTQTCDGQGGCTTSNRVDGVACGANGETCRDGKCAAAEPLNPDPCPRAATACQSDAECGSAETWHCGIFWEEGLCYAKCENDDECCPGEVCIGDADDRICVTPCATGADCEAEQHCYDFRDAFDVRFCGPPCEFNGPCESKDDCCPGDLCHQGVCARISSAPQPGDPCEFDSHCTPDNICRYPSAIQFCDPEYPCEGGICCRDLFSACAADADCCPGYACCDGTCVQLSYPGHCGSCDNVCEPAGPCQAATCQDGECGLWNVPNGTPCAEQDCLLDGQCEDGECVGTPVTDGTPCSAQGCVLNGQCAGGVCQGTLVADGTHCGEATPCQFAQSLTCLDGICHGYVFWDGVYCGDDQQCRDGICVAAFGDDQGANQGGSEGTVSAFCGSEDDCPNGQVCCMGVCAALSSDPRHCGFCGHSCPPPGAFCQEATCEAGTCGTRVAADGTACSDNMCVESGQCQGGVCQGTPIREGEGCRHPQSSCVNNPICQNGDCVGAPNPNGTTCNDFNPCTSPDACLEGTCEGTPVANGTPCGPNGYTCQAGACVPPTAIGSSGLGGPCVNDADCGDDSFRCCANSCVDVQNDVAACGDCKTTCPSDPTLCQAAVCVAGVCDTVPLLDGTNCVDGNSAFACCGGSCVDMTDEANCGVCGRVCESNELCCNRACSDPRTDSAHCGACDNPCAVDEGELCCGGQCFFKGDCAECVCDGVGCACV